MKFYSPKGIKSLNIELREDEVVLYTKLVRLRTETFKDNPEQAINNTEGVVIIATREELESNFPNWLKSALCKDRSEI